MSEEPKKSGIGKMLGLGCLVVLAAFVGLAVLGAIVGDKNAPQSAPKVATNDDQPATAVDAAPEPEDSLTGPQRNAARSANQYLAMSGFSREGLIDQLSSDAGEGYEKADATAAVDSLDVDWNEQAVRSAKQYLGMSGFSCKGLIEQLSSSAGDKYTKSEATHGAQGAGAC